MSESIIISNVEVLSPVIEVKGEIIKSNFAEIRDAIRGGLSNINLEPSSDEEFGQAKQDIANIKTVENALKRAKEETLKQAQDIQSLFAEIDDVAGELAEVRLKLDKAVREQTQKVKGEIHAAAIEKLTVTSLTGYSDRVVQAMKNKRTIKSLQEAAEREVMLINSEVEAANVIMDEFESKHGKAIVLDKIKLERMSEEALRTELQSRVDRLAAEAEAKRLREEAEKAKQEATQAKAEAEEAKKPAPAPQEPVRNAFDKRGNASEVDEREEWKAFEARVFEVFSILKAEGEKLTHPSNKAKLAQFKIAVNTGWKGVN